MNFKNQKLLIFTLILTLLFSFNLFAKTYSSKSSSKSSYKSSNNSSKSTYSSKKSTPTTNIKVKSNTTTTNTNDKKNLSKTDSDLKAKIKAQEAKDALNTTRNINKVTVKDENNYKTKSNYNDSNVNYNSTNNNKINSIATHAVAAGAGYFFGKKSAEKKVVENTTYSHPIYKAAYNNMRKYSYASKFDEARNNFKKASKAPENYYKELYPYYGIYDTIWLYEMMDNINLEKYRKFFITHYTDSDIETWKQDLKKATQKYPELLSKLNKLELEYTMSKNSDKYKYSGNLFPEDEAEMILAEYIVKNISDKYFYGKDKPINTSTQKTAKKGSPLGGLIFFAIIFIIIVIAIKSKNKN